MVCIAGIKFSEINFESVVSTIEEYVRERKPRQIVAPDTNVVVRTNTDDELKDIINTSDLVLADGMPILLASKFFGTPLPERVTGIDLALKLCERSGTGGYRIFFLGATEKVNEIAVKCLREKYPGLRVAGHYSPPFGDFTEEEELRVRTKIRTSLTDILFVSFYSGRQEKWIRRRMYELDVPVCIGVGSFLDIMSDEIRRAPYWARHIGLEWLFRFIQDPTRLFRRYFIENIKFFFLIFKSGNRSIDEA